ncbi:MAG: TIGR03960 family B12-binding radical SAM protein [Thermodesulfobacteriota bacterium]|nr:TIGR03960 family B12-binding radical SAM protein [Thermodesulfobacteriota bacterium]
MSKKYIQEILPLIERPSRYLGNEINIIKKDPHTVKLKFALVFPDLYEIGTSHFGMQILYSILNKKKEVCAERVFAPGSDMEEQLRRLNIPLVSLESKRPVCDFDVIGFSVLYELGYTNILNILELAQIPFYSLERDESYPLIIAGGPCTCNPEPIADFFDIIVVGDGENTIVEISDTWLRFKKSKNRGKESLLKWMSKIEGVYIPSFFKTEYDEKGIQILRPKYSNHTKVTRAIASNLDTLSFPDAPIVPYGKPVHDRLRLEIARGCTRGCRFCQAGMIYRPVRERSMETLLELSEKALGKTGYEDLSLLSLSTGDYECIIPLMQRMMETCQASHIAISLPSLRAGTLNTELMSLIKKVRKTGFTIAPEAGTERLRKFINKNISEKEIVTTVQDAFNLGWQVIKLYFMIGLPSETKDDIQGIVDLVNRLTKIKGNKGKFGQINVSVSTFIPKPHTPFQWESQLSLDEAKKKIGWLKKKLTMRGIRFKWQNPETSLLEGLFSRGNRRLAKLLVGAHNKGCKFDSWSDRFNFGLWQEALEDCAVDIDFFTRTKREFDEPLPWDHIDTRISKEFLIQEKQRAENLESTGDCRNGDCQGCGVCDFKIIEPRTFKQPLVVAPLNKRKNNHMFYRKLKVSFCKTGSAKYFGHLELVNIMIRALKRAGLDIKYSQGFHPKPKISFQDPLAIGIESEIENMYISVSQFIKPEEVMQTLNPQLPEGLQILECADAPSKSEINRENGFLYRVAAKNRDFDKRAIEDFNNQEKVVVTRINKKGKAKQINLKNAVVNLQLKSEQEIEFLLKPDNGKIVRPHQVLQKIFNFTEEEIRQAAVVKIRSRKN